MKWVLVALVALIVGAVGWNYRPISDDAWREAFEAANDEEIEALSNLWQQYRDALSAGDPQALRLGPRVCKAIRMGAHPLEEFTEALVAPVQRDLSLEPRLFAECPGETILRDFGVKLP